MPDSFSRKILLIVDRSVLITERITTILSDVAGVHKIFTASDYSKAVSYLTENNISIVIMDIQLPQKTGMELLKFINDMFPQIKTIILSNQVSPHYRKKCVELGASYFIDKSKEFDQIPEIIRSI